MISGIYDYLASDRNLEISLTYRNAICFDIMPPNYQNNFNNYPLHVNN